MQKQVGERATRKDKKYKVQSYVSQDTHRKVDRLARACGTSVSEVAGEMIRLMANNPEFVRWIQDKHGIKETDTFRIIPIIENGKMIY